MLQSIVKKVDSVLDGQNLLNQMVILIYTEEFKITAEFRLVLFQEVIFGDLTEDISTMTD